LRGFSRILSEIHAILLHTSTVLSRPVPAICTVLTLVCRKMCCAIQHIGIHVHIACCMHCPTWESSVMTDCEFLFPFRSFSSQEQNSYCWSWSLNVVAMMMEAATTAEMLVLLFQTIQHQNSDNNSLHRDHNDCCRLSKIILLNYMIFCIDLLLFYTTNIINFISLLSGFIYWIV
jgi:hypothetical protein